MRLLNKTFSPTAKVRRTRSLLHSFIAHGERFIMDRNSLAAAVLTETEADMAHDALETSLLFNCPYQPAEERAEQDPRFIILNLTLRCNLKCKYCFVPIHEREQRSRTMSMQTVSRALALVKTQEPQIGFFGGEPLLVGITYLRWIMDFATSHFKTPRFHLTTNGTLITQEIADELARRNVSVIVSVDGPFEIHDEGRSESWVAMMCGLQRLKVAGVKHVTGRATFTPNNLHLKERIEFLHELLNDRFLHSISIEPAALRPEQAWSQSQLAIEWEGMANYLAQNTDVLNAFGTLQVMIRRVRDGAPQVRNCGAGNGYVTIAPDGTIHACHREASPIGNVISGFDSRREIWINPPEPQECGSCWARYLCGGGCHATRRFEMQAQQCVPSKIQAEESIWLLSKKG